MGASVQGIGAKEGVEVGGADGAGCPCDQQAACRAPPAQRIWVSFISPSLLLFAMCIHGIFEGLTLGIQVSWDAAPPHHTHPALQDNCEMSNIVLEQRSSTLNHWVWQHSIACLLRRIPRWAQ